MRTRDQHGRFVDRDTAARHELAATTVRRYRNRVIPSDAVQEMFIQAVEKQIAAAGIPIRLPRWWEVAA